MDNLIKLLGYFFGQREFLLGDDMESRVADVAHDRLFVVDGVGFDRRQRLLSDSIKRTNASGKREEWEGEGDSRPIIVAFARESYMIIFITVISIKMCEKESQCAIFARRKFYSGRLTLGRSSPRSRRRFIFIREYIYFYCAMPFVRP